VETFVVEGVAVAAVVAAIEEGFEEVEAAVDIHLPKAVVGEATEAVEAIEDVVDRLGVVHKSHQ